MNVKSGVLNNTSVAQPLHVDLCQFFAFMGAIEKNLLMEFICKEGSNLWFFGKKNRANARLFVDNRRIMCYNTFIYFMLY
jgi:hypothetical protein